VHYDTVENPSWEDVLTRSTLKLNQTVPFSYVHNGQRVDTTFFIVSKQKPEDFSPDTLGFIPKMQQTPVEVSALVSGSPAEKAGLKPGDKVASIDGLQIHSVPTLLSYMQDQRGKPSTVSVLRGNQTLTLNVTPQLSDAEGSKAYRLGFQPLPPPVKVEQLSFGKSLVASWTFNRKSALLIKDVLKGMFARQISVKSLSGPIGIGQVVHQAAELPGWMPLIQTMSGISINLGMFNLLPFPILDGGMIFFLVLESLIRRDFPMHIKERVYQVAFVCLVLFAAMVIFNDITKLPIFTKLKP
jgi:regulator of sigma E protease